MIISEKHLPRDLRIIGALAFVFALFQLGGINRYSIYSPYMIFFVIFLSTGIIYFSLASGVSKKEKWAWFFGIVIFILSIMIGLLSLLLKATSILQLVIGLLIPLLFLITFIQAKKEITVSSRISIVPFVLLIVGFIMNIVSNGYLLYLVR